MKCRASVLAVVLLLFCLVPPATPEGYRQSLCREDLVVKIVRVCGKKSWRVHRPHRRDVLQLNREDGNSGEMYGGNVQRTLDNDGARRPQPPNGQQTLYNGNDHHRLLLNAARDSVPKLAQLARPRKITPRQFRDEGFNVLKKCCFDHCDFQKLLLEMC